MKSIIELEIQNLSNEEKEELLKKYRRKIQLNKNYQTFDEFAGDISKLSEEEQKEKLEEYEKWLDIDKNKKYQFDPYFGSHLEFYNDLDEVLVAYFKDYANDFIAFQKSNKNSLYRQALKRHDFKGFDYKDMVKNLTQEEKHKIISDINSSVQNLARPGEDVSLWDINPEDKKEMEAYKKLPADKKSEYKFEFYYPELEENLDKYLKNEYFLDRYDFKHEYYKEIKFFKNDNDVIYFGLKEPKIGNVLLYRHDELLNPHRQINRWLENKHALEQALKDNSEQTQKFESPKLKMKM
ncbi:hypothetical protein [Mesomycoplasma ovipneumoniae]|uniref:hypothetical protein n=1 Tax=Mesomycoplasma ovipneumoniae TaxID=29562 RepID=UPI00083E81D8|nr:hypothetical protein [Mesomycoplasma ovipneumoniae]